MKKYFLSLAIVALSISSFSQSTGDTIVVKSLHYGSAVRDTIVSFPTNTALTFSKIIMKYNMRCKDGKISNGSNRNKGCGEWDYSCNTYIHDNSKADSIASRQINYTVSSFSGDTFFYTNNAVNDFYLNYQTNTNIDSTISESQFIAGNGNLLLNHVLPTNYEASRSQHIHTNIELSNGGMTAGNIDGLLLNILSLSGSADFLRVRIKHTTDSILNDTFPDTQGFTEVYFKNTLFVSGLNRLQFHSPFNWNGTSNIIIEYSYTNSQTATVLTVEGDSTNNIQSIYTRGDKYFHFNGYNYIEANQYKGIGGNTSRTIEAWIKTTQGGKDIVSWGRNTGGAKWNIILDGNGRLRVEVNNGFKVATTDLRDDKWHHIAATFKGTNVTQVKFYVDGVLEGMTNQLSKKVNTNNTTGINLRVSRGTNNRYFTGIIDEVRVWDTELSVNDLKDWMYRPINSSHPWYNNLKVWYTLNEGIGNTINDLSVNSFDASVKRGEQWGKINGIDLFKEWKTEIRRPNAIFLQGSYLLTNTTDTILDTVARFPNSVVAYQIFPKTGTIQSDSIATTTTLQWQSGYQYFIDTNNNIIDSIYSSNQGYITFKFLDYFKRYAMRFEINSFVTPYGLGLDFGLEGRTWTFDLTDFSPILKGDKRLTMEWGGQWQEELDIQFLFIVGSPPRDVIDIDQIWRVTRPSYASISQNTSFEPRSYRLNSSASFYKIRSAITGHGQEGEFVPRTHFIDINSNSFKESWQVWKTCGDNPIHPQGGTWIYDRAGWCPGAATDIKETDITSAVTAGSTALIDYGVVTASGNTSYIVNNQLVTYGGANFSLDATIKVIKSPTSAIEYSKTNYICANPTIVIQNTGSTTLTSADIKFWINDATNKETFTWTGNLAFLEEEEVTLPSSGSALWSAMKPDGNKFFAEIINPNKGSDEYTYNNIMMSEFEIPEVLPGNFVIWFRTNGAANENKLFVYDAFGNTMFSRTSLKNNKEYRDTISLGAGCYTMVLEDSDGDGIDFWANNDGSGSLMLTTIDAPFGTIIKTFEPDFGSFIEYNFTTDFPLSFEEIQGLKNSVFNIYPNPTNGIFTVEIDDLHIKTVRLYNGGGQLIDLRPDRQGNQLIYNSNDLTKGIYLIQVESANGFESKKIVVL